MKNRSINVERAERLREARLREDDEDAHDEVAAAEQAARDADRETEPMTSARAKQGAHETVASKATEAQVHEAETRVEALRVLSRFCAFSSAAALSLVVTRLADYLRIDIFHSIHSRVLIPLVGYTLSGGAVNFGIMLFLLLPLALAGTWRMHRSLAPALDVLERAGTRGASEAIGRLVDACRRSRLFNPLYLARVTETYRRMNRVADTHLREGASKARQRAADLGAALVGAVLAAGFAYESTGPSGRHAAFLPESGTMLLLASYYVGIGFVAYRIFKRVEARITR